MHDMNRILMTLPRVFILSALLLPLMTRGGVTPVYVNEGTLTNVPQIDATIFINHGTFAVSSVLPYQTQDTVDFTNTGLMTGDPGFRLETVSAGGFRTLAHSFFNDFDATVAGTITPLVFRGALVSGGEPAQVIINASNLVSRGHLRSDAGGLVRLLGQSVDLLRSDVGINPIVGGRGFATPTNFFPDSGIIDQYWG